MKARHRITFIERDGNSKTLPIEDYLPTEWKEDGVIKTRSFPDVLKKYVKIVNEQFVEMSQVEKDAVDQAEADAATQAEADSKDFLKAASKIDKASILVVMDEINILRDELSKTQRTVEQLKTAIANKYDSLP